MPEAKKILILGGTKEAAEIASSLFQQGHDVTTSLAGRTKEPKPIDGKTRIGGYSKEFVSGAMGLAEYLEDGCFDLLIDATHPFAKQISENANLAAEISGVPLEVKTRKPWVKHREDFWHEVVNLEEACSSIPSGAIVLLALGSQHIALFAQRFDVHFVVRMVDEPREDLPLPKHTLILGKPSLQVCEEKALLEKYQVTHIVCRNSGGSGAYAKIEAARELQIPIIILSR